MKTHNIKFKLNGEIINSNVKPNEVLIDFLRYKIGVKSPKIGCDRGDCGTCTVIMNGRTVRSCLVLAVEADESDILTLEGANKNKITQKLQKKLHEKNAFQCGFCAPGMILSATELLTENSKPTKEEIKESISGNLCRCTGYEQIVESVIEVAKNNDGIKLKAVKK